MANNPGGKNFTTKIGTGLIGVGFQDTGLLKLLHDAQGHWATKVVYDALKAVHQEFAVKTSELAVAELEKAMGAKAGPHRPHSGALKDALLDDQNIDYNGQGFIFGREDWLNRQSSRVAPYWRNLEYGSRVFIGRPVLFVGPGGFHGKPFQAHDLRDISKLGEATAQYLKDKGRAGGVRGFQGVPFGFTDAKGKYTPPTAKEVANVNKLKSLHPKVIDNPIPAYHYIQRAGERFNRLKEYQYREYRNIFERFMNVNYFVQRGGEAAVTRRLGPGPYKNR